MNSAVVIGVVVISGLTVHIIRHVHRGKVDYGAFIPHLGHYIGMQRNLHHAESTAEMVIDRRTEVNGDD